MSAVRLATVDIAPELLAEFAPVISRLAKIVGSVGCDGAIRLKLEVPEEFGPSVQIIAEKTRGAILFRLIDQ